MNFDLEAWKRYLRERILPKQEIRKRAEVVERLASDKTLDWIWTELGKDARPQGSPGSFEALHTVVGTLAFPPGIIQPPTKEQTQPVIVALKKLKRAYITHLHIQHHLGYVVQGRIPLSPQQVDTLIADIEGWDFSHQRRPLMPHSQTKNAERNWIALYLKTWIIPAHFFHPHHDAIAHLIAAAYPNWAPFSDLGRDVEALVPR